MIKSLSLDKASNFAKLEGLKFSLYENKMTFLGIYHDFSLVGVAQFCFPQDAQLQELYSHELIALHLKKEYRNSKNIESILEFFINEYKPSDLFIKKELLYGIKTIDNFENSSTPKIEGQEWFSRNLTFYTYIITALDSDKYYYGVSHVKKGNASIEECQNDGYYGSGTRGKRNKFNNWKSKHKEKLQKEIIGTFKIKAEAYRSEETLVGEKWRNDPNCLNSCVGGKNGGLTVNLETFSVKICEVHGETRFQGESCIGCIKDKSIQIRVCEIHGEVIFQGDSCCSCPAQNSISVQTCSIHGETKFKGDKCYKCRSKNYSLSLCEIHGESKYRTGVCLRCKSVDQDFTLQSCITHGIAKHLKNKCCVCIGLDSNKKGVCNTHGETLISSVNEICQKCAKEKITKIEVCEDHGETIFISDSCVKCSAIKAYSKRFCKIHGEATHRGDSCVSCISDQSISFKICETHGETSFRGSSCYKCFTGSMIEEKDCPDHGVTKFSGETCCMCTADKANSVEYCETHGETKFTGDKCRKCSSAKSFKTGNCHIHGEVKFRGKSCATCSSLLTAHKRFHSVKPSDKCQQCIAIS